MVHLSVAVVKLNYPAGEWDRAETKRVGEGSGTNMKISFFEFTFPRLFPLRLIPNSQSQRRIYPFPRDSRRRDVEQKLRGF